MLKKKKSLFRKVVKIRTCIIPVIEKYTDFEHQWTRARIRIPGICLVSQASGIINMNKTKKQGKIRIAETSGQIS